MSKSDGQYLQQWLLRNGLAFDDPLIAVAVDHAIENAVRRALQAA
jgi:hypothetical protein